MAAKVKLTELVDALSMHFDGLMQFVNRETGEVVVHSDDEMGEEELDDERLVRLPSQYELHEYDVMEEFCEGVKDKRAREELLDAIRGRGAFSRFKDKAARRGLLDEWFAFREEALRKKAVEWCEENEIPFS